VHLNCRKSWKNGTGWKKKLTSFSQHLMSI